MSTRRRSSRIRYTTSPCPSGPNVNARMGLSGFRLLYGMPLQGATSRATSLGERGQRPAGSASTCCCDWLSVVTVYNGAKGPAGPWSAAAAHQPECPPQPVWRPPGDTWRGAPQTRHRGQPRHPPPRVQCRQHRGHDLAPLLIELGSFLRNQCSADLGGSGVGKRRPATALRRAGSRCGSHPEPLAAHRRARALRPKASSGSQFSPIPAGASRIVGHLEQGKCLG